ncbi:TPA: transporter [Corynebacterium striatum]|nr:transporter [Corynebacterium striatum]
MLTFLAEQPLLTLFLIMAVGLAIGKVSAWGVSLGAAAAMFVALGLSTANPDIAIPPFVYQFGLAVFAYGIGLNFGPPFFRDFLSHGWKLTLLIVIMLLILAGVTFGFLHAFDLNPAIAVGAFAGSITSTSGMAAAVETLGGDSTPVVGYSLTYPGAVIGTIIVAAIGAKLLKVNHIDDAKAEGMIAAPLEWKGVRLGRDFEGTIDDLSAITGERIIATRHIDKAIAVLGEENHVNLHEEDGLVYRRVTVSSPEVAGRTIDELNTEDKGFIIARVRKGDSDVVPAPEIVLNYSDRVRVITAPGRLDDVRRYLGVVGRSGPINWQLPFHAKQTLSTLGLTLFLAGVGTSAGGSFRAALSDPSSLIYIGVGLALTLISALGLAAGSMLLFKLKFDEAMGVVAGMTTNPAIMAYLNPQTGTQLAERGYATVYPTSMIGKILVCQVLALLLV